MFERAHTHTQSVENDTFDISLTRWRAPNGSKRNWNRIVFGILFVRAVRNVIRVVLINFQCLSRLASCRENVMWFDVNCLAECLPFCKIPRTTTSRAKLIYDLCKRVCTVSYALSTPTRTFLFLGRASGVEQKTENQPPQFSLWIDWTKRDWSSGKTENGYTDTSSRYTSTMEWFLILAYILCDVDYKITVSRFAWRMPSPPSLQ